MASSKEMKPLSIPFFPNIFFRNQFYTKVKWPPEHTNLSGKVAIVTGANQGLGFEASDQLLSFQLSRLIIAVRSLTKGEEAADMLRAKYPGAAVEVLHLDMSSYESVQHFVARATELERVDIVILNAGVRKVKPGLVPNTEHEETIQINYLSTSLLAILLVPILKQKSPEGPGRLTIVGSGLAFAAKFRNRTADPLLASFDDPESFDAVDRYNVSKLLGMMFLDKLADHVSADDVVVNIVDPGFVRGTNLTRDLPFVVRTLLTAWQYVAARPLKVGASTYVDATVVKGKESHGCYIMSWEINPFTDFQYTAEGKYVTERLWQETMEELKFAGVEEILHKNGGHPKL